MSKNEIAPSVKSGSHHWIVQKVTSIALIPLVVWFLYSIVMIVQDVDANLAVFFAYPFNAILSIILIGVSLYHGSLGMQVVFEDYIANKTKRLIAIYFVNFLSVLTGVAAIFAIIRLHLIG